MVDEISSHSSTTSETLKFSLEGNYTQEDVLCMWKQPICEPTHNSGFNNIDESTINVYLRKKIDR